MMKKILHFGGLGLAILAILAFVNTRGLFMGIQHGLQNQFYDYDRPSDKIVVVAIDEKTLKPENLGPLREWSRENYSKAIEALEAAGAKAIGIDITFPDTGPGDDALAEALRAHPNVVLSARYYFENGKRQAELPNAALLGAGPTIGWINVKQDEDGFVRQLPVFAPGPQGMTEAFALAVARVFEATEPVDFKVTDGTYPYAPGTLIPVTVERDGVEEANLMNINYFAEPGRVQQISLSDVLAGKTTDKRGGSVDFKNKIVLIGPTAIDLQDYYLSPVSQGVKMAGVEIHANAIQTVIQRAFLREAPRAWMWIMLIFLIALNLFLCSWIRVRYAMLLKITESAGILLAALVVYELGLLLNVVYPLLAVWLSFVGAFLLRFIVEQKERRFIQNAFGHYVNKSVVDQILKNPKLLELGGAKRAVTSFFSDIAGFTSVSEKMEPQELVKFLNEYLQEMSEIVLAHQGTVDKYEGDAIVAFFGAPVAMHDHARAACLTALEHQAKLRELRKKWRGEGRAELHVRIGLNTGEAVVGNMGSRDRFDYTAMGDNINLASRLEGINKQYGTKILISESTYQAVQNDLVCREIDLIRVKGKEKPVRIYELVGEKGKMKTDFSAFAAALGSYRQGKFEEARQAFAKLADDPVAQVFLARCNDFLKNRPSANWDGVYTFTTK